MILLLEPLWRFVLKPTFISTIEELVGSAVAMLPQLMSPQILALVIAVGPLLASLALFAVQARTGFNLCGSGIKPVYVPRGFREVISFIRNVQNQQQIPLAIEHFEPES